MDNPTNLAKGAVGEVVSIMVDVTEQNQLEESLQETEAVHRCLYDDPPVMTYSIDAELRIVGAGAVDVALLPADVALTEVTFGGKAATLLRRGGLQFAALEPSERKLQARLVYLVPVIREPGGERVALVPLPPVAGSTLSVSGAGTSDVTVWPAVELSGVLSLSLALMELPHQIGSPMPSIQGQPVYVLGDSISVAWEEGTGDWTDVLRQKHGLDIINLAEAGATTRGAIRQTQRVPPGPAGPPGPPDPRDMFQP